MSNLHFDVSEQTKKKLKNVMNLYNNNDMFFNDVIDYQIQKIKKEQLNLHFDLLEFENLYNITSVEFYKLYKLGKQGDNQDTLLWAGIYEMFLENNKKLSKLL